MRPVFLPVTCLLTLGACFDRDPVSPNQQAGPLGAVEIGAGEAVQIRSLLSITGAASLGGALRYGCELAVADYGNVHGRPVDLRRVG